MAWAGRRTLEVRGLAERYALEELVCDPGTVTFVSAHAWDLAGAAHAGMGTAFVARGEPLASAYPRPDIIAADLTAMAPALG